MKKNVLVFGIISGVIVTSMMLYALSSFYNNPGFEGNMLLGYAAMLAAFSFVFVGIRNYRNKYNGGYITFGRAILTGLYISVVASTIYVLVWLITYYQFLPDFMEKYSEHVITLSEKNGATAHELAGTKQEMASFKEMYRNPLMVILITYSEVFPAGLAVTLISALILSKKPRQETLA